MWSKLAEEVYRDPKLKAAIDQTGPDLGWFWMCGLSYSADHHLDGWVPTFEITTLAYGVNARRAKRLVAVLCKVLLPGKQSLWHPRDDLCEACSDETRPGATDAFYIHDWTKHNFTAEEYAKRHEDKLAQRSAAGRARAAAAPRNGGRFVRNGGEPLDFTSGSTSGSTSGPLVERTSDPPSGSTSERTSTVSDTDTEPVPVSSVVDSLSAALGSGARRAADFEGLEDPLPDEIVAVLSPDEAHLLRQTCRSQPRFGELKAGHLERIRTERGPKVRYEVLIRLRQSIPEEILAPAAYLDEIVAEVVAERARFDAERAAESERLREAFPEAFDGVDNGGSSAAAAAEGGV